MKIWRGARCRAFTLLEMLLAMAIGLLLMVGLYFALDIKGVNRVAGTHYGSRSDRNCRINLFDVQTNWAALFPQAKDRRKTTIRLGENVDARLGVGSGPHTLFEDDTTARRELELAKGLAPDGSGSRSSLPVQFVLQNQDLNK